MIKKQFSTDGYELYYNHFNDFLLTHKKTLAEVIPQFFSDEYCDYKDNNEFYNENNFNIYVIELKSKINVNQISGGKDQEGRKG